VTSKRRLTLRIHTTLREIKTELNDTMISRITKAYENGTFSHVELHYGYRNASVIKIALTNDPYKNATRADVDIIDVDTIIDWIDA
jgi:hypothetical protein